jgi:hypothetical protein
MIPTWPTRHQFVSGNRFELRKPVGRISKLLIAVRQFVTLVSRSRQYTSLKHSASKSAKLAVKARNFD